jgi:lipopolysaccharide transport system permease protein
MYAINPMVGVIEGFRTALLGTGQMPWDLIAIGMASTTVFLVTGMLYFRRQERLFSDVA